MRKIKGLFETMLSVDDFPLLLNEHVDRMFRGAPKIFLKPPVGKTELKKRLQSKLKGKKGLHRVRVEVESDAIRILIEPFAKYRRHHYEQGVKVGICETVKNDPSGEAQIKRLSRPAKEKGEQEATGKGWEEGLLMSRRGRITEGCRSNVFIVRDKTLMTPPLSDGLLDGTVRRKVLQLAKDLGVAVQLRSLSRADLQRCEEAFLTSSLRGVLPIVWLDGKAFKKPGPITELLLQTYTKKTGHRIPEN